MIGVFNPLQRQSGPLVSGVLFVLKNNGGLPAVFPDAALAASVSPLFLPKRRPPPKKKCNLRAELF
jgi:hypothetical protein